MKYTIHVPVEQFGFVSAEFEAGPEGYENARHAYDDIKAAFTPRPINELPPKEFDQFIQNQLLGDTNHTETIEKMSPAQKLHYNINKRAIARINAKQATERLSEKDLDND